MNLKSICGVILASDNPEKLAGFYGTVFDLEFEREIHGDLLEHFGADIGTVHLGIHPPSNLAKTKVGNASVSVAYNVDSLAEVLQRLATLGAKELKPPHDEGFGVVASFLDPDGNQFEVVELAYEFKNA